jgi:translation elongation factor P/translation initiation factor 5A
MPIKTDLVNGKDLKIGSIFIPNGEKTSFYKIDSITESKPGKHGTTKTLVTARNIITGKNFIETFKETDEKVLQVIYFDYVHRIVHGYKDGIINVNLETGENLNVQNFNNEDQKRLTEALDVFINGKGLADGDSPLVIKYSELIDDSSNTLIFWELLYIPTVDLLRHGISI